MGAGGGRERLGRSLAALFVGWYSLALALGALGVISFRPPNGPILVGLSKALVAYAASRLDRLVQSWAK